MNQPWVYMCSPSWTPPPSPFHPSGSSQCTSLEHPDSCIDPGLAICCTYDNIHVSVLFSQIIPPMFQCYSLKSSHPRLLPQSLKDCSIHLCLFCCLAYSVIIPVPVQLLSCVRLFATPWITAHQASLSITNSQNLPKPMSTESVMPSNPICESAKETQM